PPTADSPPTAAGQPRGELPRGPDLPAAGGLAQQLLDRVQILVAEPRWAASPGAVRPPVHSTRHHTPGPPPPAGGPAGGAPSWPGAAAHAARLAGQGSTGNAQRVWPCHKHFPPPAPTPRLHGHDQLFRHPLGPAGSGSVTRRCTCG